MVGRAPLFREVFDERRDVFPALAQRREGDGDEVDAVEEVFAECAFGYHGREVGVGGAHDTDVDVSRAAVAEHFETVFLKHAEQFHLGVHVEFAYFVEKYGAFVGEGEPPFAVGRGACEGSFAMAEHLAFEK